jgi:hypothetical protein
MTKFIPEGLVAHVLGELKGQIIDLIADGEATPENVASVFSGGFAQLDIKPAQGLGVAPDKEAERIFKA